MLCAHPRIYITHEAAFYGWQAIYSRRAPSDQFLDYYFQTTSFRWLRLDPERVLAALPHPLPHDRLRDAFIAIMREKAADYGRVRFGDKTPAHAGQLKRIFRDFPDAKVVHIVRDPRATAVSLLQMPWASQSLFCNAAMCDLEWRSVQKHHDRILQIRLEDLVMNPRATMGRVLDYVDEPWSEDVLDHARHIPDGGDMPPFPWTESAAGPIAIPAARSDGLSPVQIRMVEHVARRGMKAMGYQSRALPREPGTVALWWEGWKQVPESIRFLTVWWQLRRHLRDRRNFDTPETAARWHRLNPPAWERYPGLDRLLTPPERTSSRSAGRSVPPLLESGTPDGKSEEIREMT